MSSSCLQRVPVWSRRKVSVSGTSFGSTYRMGSPFCTIPVVMALGIIALIDERIVWAGVNAGFVQKLRRAAMMERMAAPRSRVDTGGDARLPRARNGDVSGWGRLRRGGAPSCGDLDLGAKLPCVRWFVMIGASDECSVVDAAKSVGLLAEKVNGRKHPVGLQAELHPSHAKRALGNHPTSRTQLHGLRRPGTTKQCRCPCTKAFSNANSRHHRPRKKSHSRCRQICRRCSGHAVRAAARAPEQAILATTIASGQGTLAPVPPGRQLPTTHSN